MITASYNKTTSIDLDIFRRLRVLFARNQTQQDALDWVKLSGVDERVKADVEICDGQHSVQALLINGELRMNVETENEGPQVTAYNPLTRIMVLMTLA